MPSKQRTVLFKLALAFIPLILVWGLDWVTKYWASNLSDPIEFGILKFELIHNYGIMLGISSHLPILVKTIALTTLGATILCSFALVLIIVPINSLWLRIGVSILTGGIIGNVTDRFVHGAVIDFIAVKYGASSTPYLNVADIFQWIGYASIWYGLYLDSQYYWPKKDWRNKFFINPKFQLRTGFLMGIFSFFTGFILLAFGFSFFQGNLENENIKFYLYTGSVLILLMSLILFVLGVIISHRIAGPIYAIHRYLNDSLSGKHYKFKLRENDEFKEIEIPLTKLNEKIYYLTEMDKNMDDEVPPPLPTDI